MAAFNQAMADLNSFDDDSEERMDQKVASTKIPWAALHSATIITAEHLQLITAYDKQPANVQAALVKEKPVEHAELFMFMVTHISKEDTLQYVLLLLQDFLNADESRCEHIFAVMEGQSPFAPFYRVFSRVESDRYIISKASKIVSTLLVAAKLVSPDDEQYMVRWVMDKLRAADPADVSLALTLLQTLLRKPAFRTAVKGMECVPILAGLVKTFTAHFQLLYRVVYCLWLLSYSADIAAYMGTTTAIPMVVHCVRVTAKEKVVRIGLALLGNLLGKGNNNRVMIQSGFVKLLENLKMKKWGDEDILADLESLEEGLSQNIQDLGSFDVYKQELITNALEWSPVHRSEKFWRENHLRFEDNNMEALGILVELVKNSTDPQVLSVACFDVGEFVRFHPRGRALIARFGVKEHIMRLMAHTNPDVQKHALLAVQKLMVHNWEYLNH